MTGERFFLHYAFPCAEDKYLAGKISFGDYQLLKRSVQIPGLSPDRELLARCFPTACQRFSTFTIREGLEPWSLSTVAEYWRHHHEGKEHCTVRLATIKVTGKIRDQDEVFLVDCDGQGIFVSNPLHYQLRPGDQVYVHWQVIVEKVESE